MLSSGFPHLVRICALALGCLFLLNLVLLGTHAVQIDPNLLQLSLRILSLPVLTLSLAALFLTPFDLETPLGGFTSKPQFIITLFGSLVLFVILFALILTFFS